MKVKRLIALIVICAFLTPTVFATPRSGERRTSVFEGSFVASDLGTAETDLSQIEVKVYQCIPKPQVVKDYIEYDNTYLYSVYSDEEGNFSFEIPAQTFFVSIVLETLPANTGVKQKSKLYHSDTGADTFSLYQIADVSMSVDALDEEPNIALLAEDGDMLLAEYDVVYTPRLSNDDVLLEGMVNLQGGVVFNVSTEFDLSNLSKVEKSEQLYLAGLISEEEHILDLASMLSMDNISSDPMEKHIHEPDECGTWVVDKLAEYKESEKYELSLPAVKQAVDDALAPKMDLMVSAGVEKDVRTSNPPYEDNDYFTVYYYDGVEKDAAEETLALLTSLRSQALLRGFKMPRLQSGKSTLQVYLYPQSNSEGRGLTYSVERMDGTAASYIEIWGMTSWSPEWGETIAHEYFHAIQNAYFYYNSWFKEASAVWFAARYSNSIARAQGKFNEYFAKCAEGIEDADNEYGAGVLPMAIDVAFGGPATIRKIYENFDIHNANINASMMRDDIASAIRSYDSSGSFERALEITAAYITFPYHFYSSIIPDTETPWTNDLKEIGSTSKSINLSSFGCRPVNYTATTSTPKTMGIVIDFDGISTAKTSARVVFKSGNNITPVGRTSIDSVYTAEITNFGTNGNSIIDVVPIYYNSSFSCTANISITYL